MRIFTMLLVALLSGTVWADESVSVRILEEGYGPAIKTGEVAVLTYSLETGRGVFIGESTERAPLSFELGSDSVIPGFSRGVEGMKLDETREIKVPPSLGYGDKAKGPIPPNSTLVFKVKLLKIDPPVGTPDEEESLSDKFQNEDFLNGRHAQSIGKPAMFEYVIRDFFTKPWRYEDGHRKIFRQCLPVSVVFVFLGGFFLFGARKGYWIP